MADSKEFPVGSGPDRTEFRAGVEGLEMGADHIREKDFVGVELSGRVTGQEKCETGGGIRSEEVGSELFDIKVIDERVLSRGELCEISVDSGCSIQDHMGKVSLDEAPTDSIVEDVNGKIIGVNDVDSCDVLNSGERIKGGGISDVMDGSGSVVKSQEAVDDKGGDSSDDSQSENESSSSSWSSSSSSSSSDDDDCGDMAGGKTSSYKEGKEVDVEEGEILLSDAAADEMVGWSDNENDEDTGTGTGTAGPITSKNEVKILPPVPSITVTLQPRHHNLPVGQILSILGVQVIVEGIEKHNPLNEGSILWITESRLPLGIIDEIFGPVKNPYYVVRYNCESEVPSNIQQGTSISFVPEFANHVLNDKSLYQKGYDASGENDEELPVELEFSDDEKEAEYKKMLKMNKRGTSNSESGTKRKDKRQFKNQPGNWKSNQVPLAKTPNFSDNIPVTESLNYGNSAALGLAFTASQAIVPPLSVQTPMPGFRAPNGLWGNRFLGQQPLSIDGLSGVPAGANFMPWMQQNQQPFQFHLQNSTIPELSFNFSSSVDQPNFGGVPAFTPWLGLPNQNVFNQLSTGMGSQTTLPQNEAEQVFHCGGSRVSNSLQPSPVNTGNIQNFNRARGGGRRGHHRGGGRHDGGRGTSRSR